MWQNGPRNRFQRSSNLIEDQNVILTVKSGFEFIAQARFFLMAQAALRSKAELKLMKVDLRAIAMNAR